MRIEKGLTQEELANRCELSKGFISQVENDLTSPSIATLIDILEILGTNLKEFFSDDKDEKITYKYEDMFETENHDLKYKLMWLVPNAQKNEMEPIILELNAHASSKVIEPHDGEEIGYVLNGKIYVHVDGSNKGILVKKGETFYLHGTRAHHLENKSEKKAVVLWISTPPIF